MKAKLFAAIFLLMVGLKSQSQLNKIMESLRQPRTLRTAAGADFTMGAGDGLEIKFSHIDNRVNLFLVQPNGITRQLPSTDFIHNDPPLSPDFYKITVLNCCNGEKALAQYYTLIIEIENEVNSGNYNPFHAAGTIVGTKYINGNALLGVTEYYKFDFSSNGNGNGLSGAKVRYEIKFQAF